MIKNKCYSAAGYSAVDEHLLLLSLLYQHMLDTCFEDTRVAETQLDTTLLIDDGLKLWSSWFHNAYLDDPCKNAMTTALSAKGVGTRYFERSTCFAITE